MSIFTSKTAQPEPMAERLLQLAAQVASQLSLAELLHTVQQGIAESVAPEHLAIFVRQHALLEVQSSIGETWQPAPFIASNDPLCQLLEARLEKGNGEPLQLATVEPLTEGGLLLQTRGVRRVLPLAAAGQLLGFVAIGRKQEPRAYRPAELAAFAVLGQQVGAVLQRALRVAALTAAASDQAQQLHLHQFARQVQTGYQLDAVPTLPHWDLAGCADNVAGVPSAFFDCFVESEQLLHFCIASVQDDLNPLALRTLAVASGLRTAFRCLARASRSANGVLSQISLGLQPTLAHQQAHLCYGQLNLKTGALEYATAGNCTLLLYLPNVAEPIVCPSEGPAISAELTVYKSYHLTIKPDFALVAYTDTLSVAQQVLFQPDLVGVITQAVQPSETAHRLVAHVFPQLLGQAQPSISNDLSLFVLRRAKDSY